MIDFLAIATTGFFPTPTPTDTERMAFASTWGYLSVVPFAEGDDGIKRSTLLHNFSISIGLGKSEALKKGWEDRLEVDLLDQEVWSIITPEKEEMCDDILEDLVGESSIKPNKIHENENE